VVEEGQALRLNISAAPARMAQTGARLSSVPKQPALAPLVRALVRALVQVVVQVVVRVVVRVVVQVVVQVVVPVVSLTPAGDSGRTSAR
jgi:hypothetical protein